ncbi:MAG: hypothetical protein EHM70_02975 [Chloroflexota bacterium]|nr:MAG: hypothetical protein EHM70_02975 [Chloroflexota bacterium]
MWNRITGVFKLDSATFEEVEHDTTATGQAALVVALVAILLGLGSGFTTLFGSGEFVRTFIGSLLSAFVGWILWSAASYFAGTTLFGGKADLGEMLRVIGFASAPLMLGIIPCIGGIIGALWAAAAGFVAVRQGLDLDNGRAILTVLLGFVLYIAGYMILNLALGSFSGFLG